MIRRRSKGDASNFFHLLFVYPWHVRPPFLCNLCCSVLQYVAVCCIVLQCVAEGWSDHTHAHAHSSSVIFPYYSYSYSYTSFTLQHPHPSPVISPYNSYAYSSLFTIHMHRSYSCSDSFFIFIARIHIHSSYTSHCHTRILRLSSLLTTHIHIHLSLQFIFVVHIHIGWRGKEGRNTHEHRIATQCCSVLQCDALQQQHNIVVRCSVKEYERTSHRNTMLQRVAVRYSVKFMHIGVWGEEGEREGERKTWPAPYIITVLLQKRSANSCCSVLQREVHAYWILCVFAYGGEGWARREDREI